MDEVIICKCGNIHWVIGTSGVRCEECQTWLEESEVTVDIPAINKRLQSLREHPDNK